jgi:hypothetical protein
MLLWLGFVLTLAMLVGPVACGPGGGTDPNDCTQPGQECDTGNKCDATTKTCVCDEANCSDGKGCHPDKKTCEAFCSDNADCNDGETCQGEDGGNKFCKKAEEKECESNDDCKDAAKPKCDTATFKCIADTPAGCKNDDDCLGDANGEVCNTDDGKCVGCLDDTDCDNGEACNMTNNTCEKSGCTDTPTCYKANAKSYCAENDKDAGCKEAPATCDAAKKVSSANASKQATWATDIAAGGGSTVWGIQTNIVSSKSCWSYAGAKEECNDVSDCSSPSADGCYSLSGKKWCGKMNKNGTVEVSFKYYNPAGQFPSGCYDCVKTHAANPATGLTLASGSDGTSGSASFSICIDNAGTYQFFIVDKASKPSNMLCYEKQ